MKRSILFLYVLVSTQCYSQEKWTTLLDGKDLSGWNTYIGPAYDSAAGTWTSEPVGLNRDPRHVFSIVDVDGAPALRISGELFGGISTVSTFANYHLRLEFKWGTLKWNPKKNDKRDSGLLYHAVGDYGADFGFWMRSQEFQIQEGDCGDYWGVAGGSFEVPAVKNTKGQFVYTPGAPRSLFNEKSPHGRRCIKSTEAERPTGQWNVVDLYCHGDTAVHMINGVVVMVLYKSGQLEGGKVMPLTSGKIELQSEGAEIFYRKIALRPIDRLPDLQ